MIPAPPVHPDPTAASVVLTPGALAEHARAVFVAAGAADAVARRVAGYLVLANQSGHDSHGAIRIPQYVRDVREGRLDPRAAPAVRRAGPAWALVDGGWAFGHETARFAMAEAIARAGTTGVALVSAIRANHIGRLGDWAEQAAAARMVGIVGVAFSHVAALLVAPFGGAGRALSTNPIAIAVPRAEGPPLLLDFATSIVPEGKVRVAREKGVAVPEGTLLDPGGHPTTDPEDLYRGGVLVPFARHKGYALSFMVDALCIALGGADEPEARGVGGFESGAFFLAVDPAIFGPFDRFASAIERLARRVKAVPPAPGFREVLLPGDPEHRARAERAERIALPPATWAAIAEAAASVGVRLAPPP